MEKSKLNLLAFAVLCVFAGDRSIQAQQFFNSLSYTHPAVNNRFGDEEAVTGTATYSHQDTGQYWLAGSLTLSPGTYYVAASVRASAGEPGTVGGTPTGNIELRQNGTVILSGGVSPSAGTYEDSADMWMLYQSEGFGCISLGTCTVGPSGSISVKILVPSQASLITDGLFFYTNPEYAFPSRSAINAYLNPEPEWYTLNCSLVTSPVRALDIGGNWAPEGAYVMSYAVENGVLVASGDMSPMQEMEALRLATGRKYFSLTGNDYCGPMWVSFGIGGRQFVNSDSFTLSEWAFAEVVYWERSIAHGGPAGLYNSAEMLGIWESENRYPLLGDPLGDVGLRLYQKFAELEQQ